jgi:hypothetical protein
LLVVNQTPSAKALDIFGILVSQRAAAKQSYQQALF